MRNINDAFIITFQPKYPEQFGGRKRFSVGCWSLWKYIGDVNAVNLLKKIVTLEGENAKEKYTKHYPKYGIITLYAK